MKRKNKTFLLYKASMANEWRLQEMNGFSKSGRGKRTLLMGAVMALIVLIFAGYAAGLAYSLSILGIGDVIPVYGMYIVGIATLFFTVMKTNGILFGYRDYEILAALPVRTASLIGSRFLMMYTVNLAAALVIMVPMGAVYFAMEDHSLVTVIFWTAGALLSPLIPTTIAAVVGAAVMFVSVRMKYASLAASVLGFIAIIAVLALSMQAGQLAEMETDLADLAVMGDTIKNAAVKTYPVCGLFGSAVTAHSFVAFSAFVLLSLGWYAVFLLGISKVYHSIQSALKSHAAKAGYRLGDQRGRTVLQCLCLKELKRFFSNSVFLMNVGIGELLAVMMAVFLLAAGPEKVLDFLQIPFSPAYVQTVNRIAPFAAAGMLSMACTTCTSLSLEGKNIWILKSLPLPAAVVFQGKILANIVFILPGAVLTGLAVCLRTSSGAVQGLSAFFVPFAVGCYAAVSGMYLNIKFPVYDWESETQIIKRSMSSFLGMMNGAMVSLVLGAAACMLPQGMEAAGNAAAVLVSAAAAAFFYRLIVRSAIPE